MCKLFCSIPLNDENVEIVGITTTSKNFKEISDIISEKFKNEVNFKFIPPIEEQLKKQSKNKKVIHTIWADVEEESHLKDLRYEIEKSIEDPNYVIVTNYGVYFKDIEINTDSSYLLLVYGEDIGTIDVEDLRNQIDCALSDPNYIIITNYEVHISQHKKL